MSEIVLATEAGDVNLAVMIKFTPKTRLTRQKYTQN